MKTLQIILALGAFFALGMPCVHAEGHHHHKEPAAELCAEACDACHSSKEVPCSKPEELVRGSFAPAQQIPVRQTPLITVFSVDHLVPEDDPRPAEDLQCLRTVQLLI